MHCYYCYQTDYLSRCVDGYVILTLVLVCCPSEHYYVLPTLPDKIVPPAHWCAHVISSKQMDPLLTGHRLF